MRHIGSDDHGGDFLIVFDRNPRECAAIGTARATTKLRVHLHTDVGNVLRLARENVSALEALRRNAVAALASLLNGIVRDGILHVAREDEEDQLRLGLELVASLVPGIGDHLTTLRDLFNKDGRICALDDTAVAFVNADKLVDKLLSGNLIHSWAGPALENAEAPRPQRLLVRSQESHASKLPATTNSLSRGDLALAKCNLGSWKDASLDSSRLRIDLQSEVCKIGILLPLEHSQAMFNCLPTLLRQRDGKLDHVRRLRRIELEWVALILRHPEKVDGKELALGCLDQGDSSQDILAVLLAEILQNGDLLAILLKSVGGAIHRNETLDGVFRGTVLAQDLDLLENLDALVQLRMLPPV